MRQGKTRLPGSGHRRRALGFFLVSAAGIALLVRTIVRFPVHGEEWLLTLGIFLSIPPLTWGGITLWMGAKADKLYRDGGTLARWTLTPETQDAHAEAVYEKEKELRGAALAIGGALVALAFVFKLTLFGDMTWEVFMLLMAVLLALLLFVAFGMPWLAKRQMRRDPPEVAIGLYSAALPGQFVIWNMRQMGMVTARVISVTLAKDYAGNALTVRYESFVRTGYQAHDCRIPVPEGKLAEAAEAGRKIAEAGGAEFRDEIPAA